VSLPDDADEAEFGAIWRREDAHPLRERFLEAVATVVSSDNVLAGAAPAS
jgi:hypothetical protein